MGSKSKTLALMLVLLFLLSLATYPLSAVKAQTSNLVPAIAWKHIYGEWNVEHSSNLVQTNDSGFIFMDTGWHYQVTLKPATIYKLDSSGNTQWNKTIDNFVGDVIIQTSDGGYEMTGEWSASIPTLIKTDSNGNIQWVQNYSRVPSLGISGIMQFYEGYNATPYQTTIKTSDGGFVSWSLGQITKTDLANRTQWVENISYSKNYPSYYRLPIFWLIETSDGSLAYLGVGTALEDNRFSGNIYLYKTEPFLPTPKPSQLPTPIPTSTPTPTVTTSTSWYIVIIGFIWAIAMVISLLLYSRHRKTAILKQ